MKAVLIPNDGVVFQRETYWGIQRIVFIEGRRQPYRLEMSLSRYDPASAWRPIYFASSLPEAFDRMGLLVTTRTLPMDWDD